MSLHARITRRPTGNHGAPNLPAADDALKSVRAGLPAPPVARLSSPPASA